MKQPVGYRVLKVREEERERKKVTVCQQREPQVWKIGERRGGEEGVDERSPKGGKFACVHLRRGDYARGRGSRAPTIKGAAEQVGQALTSRGLETLFVATDADVQEWQRFKKGLEKFKVDEIRKCLLQPSEVGHKVIETNEIELNTCCFL